MSKRDEKVQRIEAKREEIRREVEARLNALGVDGVCKLAQKYRAMLTPRQRRELFKGLSEMTVARFAMTQQVKHGYFATPEYCR